MLYCPTRRARFFAAPRGTLLRVVRRTLHAGCHAPSIRRRRRRCAQVMMEVATNVTTLSIPLYCYHGNLQAPLRTTRRPLRRAFS